MLIMKPDGWLGVELRHLAALQAVAREGSFGGAAVALGYSQSAVSQQIAALERIVGERLVERPGGPRPVSLTDAGKLLLGHAEGIVARLEAAQADLAAYSEGSAGTLRVGTYQSVGARVLPRVMLEFAGAWPLVSIQLTESTDDAELLGLDERGELDVVTGVERVEIDAPVYDLDVERTHNFVANGIVTHNSVYRFRGADYRNLMKFEDVFPESTIIVLDQNYRSTMNILHAANSLIAHNRLRHPKSLWSARGDGEPVRVYRFVDEGSEARDIASLVREAIDEGTPSGDIAIF